MPHESVCLLGRVCGLVASPDCSLGCIEIDEVLAHECGLPVREEPGTICHAVRRLVTLECGTYVFQRLVLFNAVTVADNINVALAIESFRAYDEDIVRLLHLRN